MGVFSLPRIAIRAEGVTVRTLLAAPAFSLQRRIILYPVTSLSASAIDTVARDRLQRRAKSSRVLVI